MAFEPRVIAGRYQLFERLGKGAMGVVYRAHDPVLDRIVAVKMMSADMGEDGRVRDRFLKEARAAARLNHRHVVTIHELVEVDGEISIIMELLDGVDLATIISGPAPLPLASQLTIFDQVLDGLHYAHEQGVVHRDIKPANLHVTSAGVAKILDFGIARLVSAQMTGTRGIVGTPAYMSPEQAMGRAVDRRTDLFALGTVLYELLSGARPFQADSIGRLMAVIAETPHQPLGPEVPPEVARLVDRLLSKDPAGRPETAAAARAELSRARQAEGVAATDNDPTRDIAEMVRETVTARETIAPVSAPPLEKRPASAGERGPLDRAPARTGATGRVDRPRTRDRSRCTGRNPRRGRGRASGRRRRCDRRREQPRPRQLRDRFRTDPRAARGHSGGPSRRRREWHLKTARRRAVGRRGLRRVPRRRDVDARFQSGRRARSTSGRRRCPHRQARGYGGQAVVIVKVCGITRAADARVVATAGADAIGFVFAPSTRRIPVETAQAIDRAITGHCRRVGVFVDAAFDEVRRAIRVADLDVAQLHGAETDEDCRRIAALGVAVWKRLDVTDEDSPETLAARGRAFAVDALLVDPGKGDGLTFRWALTQQLAGPLIVAGGLTPDNVANAIRATHAHGVDVSSGVETAPGIKDEQRIVAFVERVRAAEGKVDGNDAT